MNKNNKKNCNLFIVFVLLIAVWSIFFYNGKPQSSIRVNKSSIDTSDSSSNYIDDCPQKKTWEEMTSKERKACEEYFEDKFESGEWSFND